LIQGFRTITLLFVSLAACSIAGAQAFPTAPQPLQFSAFGAATGTFTGLDGGRNLGITAGIDVGFKPFYHFYPTAEVRGTYPIDGGQVDAQENILYGIKLARFYGRYHPYANFLVGRGKINYQHGGYPNPSDTLLYIDSVSNVFSYGGGLDLDITDHVSLKVDAQFQQYATPVTPSGHLYSIPITVGLVYRFDFNHHIRYNADGQVKGYSPPPEPRSAPTPPPAPENPAPANTSDATPQPPSSDTSAPAKPSPDTPAPNTSTPQPPVALRASFQ